LFSVGSQQGGPVLDTLNVIMNELNLIVVLGLLVCRWKFKVQRVKSNQEIGQTKAKRYCLRDVHASKQSGLPDVIVDVN
jgi:hypothetical protein